MENQPEKELPKKEQIDAAIIELGEAMKAILTLREEEAQNKLKMTPALDRYRRASNEIRNLKIDY